MMFLSCCLSNEKFERLSGPLDEIVLFCTVWQWHVIKTNVVDLTLFTMKSFERHVAKTLATSLNFLLNWVAVNEMFYCISGLTST